jgi:hypothetical protein
MAKQENPIQTKIIDNFKGSMTWYVNGDMNSGLANEVESFGYDPFAQPGDLTWVDAVELIDPDQNVLTDLILAGKTRVENGITYCYAIGHTGRVYKIQVNDPTTYNPDYDNPVLLTTLTQGTPTFTRGAFIDFYGTTSRIYISHDKGVTQLDFNGTNETVVGSAGSWVQNVPKPLKQFLGNLIIGNGPNLALIDSTLTVITYTKLSPGFPSNTQVRDLDITPDGLYLQAVVTELALSDITSVVTDTSINSPSDSFIFKWNGTDVGYTSMTNYPSTVLSANCIFGNNQYVFGYDYLGGGVYNPTDKFLTSLPSSEFSESPFPNAVSSYGNLITWITPLPFEGHLLPIYCIYGTVATGEIDKGYWSPLSFDPQEPETDIIHVPCQILVSNYTQGSGSNGYTNSIFGTPKIYISTIETSSAPTVKYRLYKWHPIVTGLGTTNIIGVYQTQTQLFSKKVKATEVRIYGQPWVGNNAFTIDLIGSDGMPIPGASMSFTSGINMTIGEDFAWYNPSHKPTYCMGLRISNNEISNMTIIKVEIDYIESGK